MKREYTTHHFKVKYSCGIHNRGTFFEYVGKSRIDGFPIYSCEVEKGTAPDWRFYFQDFAFCGRPGYTPENGDFEYIPSLEDHISQKRTNTLESTELPVVKPLSPPSGILYYIDYVYDEFDERLILML